MAELEMEFVRKDNGQIIMVNTGDQWFGFQRVSIQGRGFLSREFENFCLN